MKLAAYHSNYRQNDTTDIEFLMTHASKVVNTAITHGEEVTRELQELLNSLHWCGWDIKSLDESDLLPIACLLTNTDLTKPPYFYL